MADVSAAPALDEAGEESPASSTQTEKTAAPKSDAAESPSSATDSKDKEVESSPAEEAAEPPEKKRKVFYVDIEDLHLVDL